MKEQRKVKCLFRIVLAEEGELRDAEKIRTSGRDIDSLHLRTCLFIVTAAGTQKPTGECQTADGLQMNFLQFKLTNYTRINKSKRTDTPKALKKMSSFNHLI